MLCENGQPSQTVSFSGNPRSSNESNLTALGLKDFILSGRVDPPRITADEINDRSKGDAVSKCLAIFQTTWFIIQCFARWSARLSVTELENYNTGICDVKRNRICSLVE